MRPHNRKAGRDPVHRRLREDAGFTLVEVMVSCMLLALGVIATVSLIDAANRTTSVTRAREAATSLGRSMLESARSIPYASLTKADTVGLVQARRGLGDSDPGTAGWQVNRRNISYTVDLQVCAVDDPSDGIGTDNSEFCTTGTPSSPPDTKPADYKRVNSRISWRDASGTHVASDSAVVTGTYRGPTVLTLTSTPSLSSVYTSTSTPAFINFAATTSADANNVHWSVDGDDKGLATGGGTSWVFSWDLGAPTGGAPCSATAGGVADGSYVIRADAYDVDGLSATSRAVTAQLNRCPPAAITGLEGGENKLWPGIELQWDDSPEEDVIGYRVYTSPTGAAGTWTAVPTPSPDPDATQPDCSGLVRTPNCVDPDHLGGKIYYAVRAFDKDPSGNERPGDWSPALLIDPANNAPNQINNGDIDTDNAFPWSIKWKSAGLPPTPPPADYTDFYYVYRDTQNGRPDRYDSTDVAGGTIQWTDPDPDGQAHTYWVTANDNHLAESNFSRPIYCDAAGACHR